MRCLFAAVLGISLLGVACEPAGEGTLDPLAQPTMLTLLHQGSFDVKVVTPRDGGAGMHLLYLPLFTIDEKGDLAGRLVESWEHSAEYSLWTYRFRPNVRWHDGAPVTAHDVEFTYRTYAHPDVLRMSPACAVTVVDDLTLTIRANDGCWPEDWWNVVLPSHLFGDLDGEEVWQSDLWDDPVGNGPYRFARYTEGTAIELEANPDFYAGRPRIDRVVVRLMSGANPVTELQAGNVDIAPASLAAAALLAGDERFEVYYGQPQVGWALAWNHRHPILGDRDVREALTLAMDKRELGRLYHYPPGAPIADVPLSQEERRQAKPPEPLPHDPVRSLELLRIAGWSDDGNGVLKRDGTSLEFELFVSSRSMQAGVLIQDQLAAIGARVELRSIDRNLIMQRVWEGDFEAALPGGIKGSSLLRLIAGEEPDWESPIGYENPELPDIVTALEGSLDPAEKQEAHGKLQALFRRDFPMSMVVPNMGNASVVTHRKVKGLRSPLLWFPVMIVDRLWIEEEE